MEDGRMEYGIWNMEYGIWKDGIWKDGIGVLERVLRRSEMWVEKGNPPECSALV